MVKIVPIPSTPSDSFSTTHTDFSTDFIKPFLSLPDEAILELSTPREFTFSDPPPPAPSHDYVFFVDFVQKGRVANTTVEERISDEEYRIYSPMIDTIIHNYQENQPDEPLAGDDQVYLEAFLKSPYQQDVYEYFSGTAYMEATIKPSKPKGANKLSFRDKQVLGQFSRRDREFILQSCDEGLSAEQIAHQLKLRYKAESISGLMALHKRFGKKLKLLKAEKKGPRVTAEVEALVVKIGEDPDLAQMTLAEMDNIVERKAGVRLGASAISHILKDNGFSKKKPTFAVPESDCVPHKNARIKVVKTLIGYLLADRDIVSIDETQVQAGFMRTSVWGKKGARTVLPAGRKGKPVHIIAAIWKHGLLGYMVRDDRIKSNGHIFFLGKLFEELRLIDPHNYKNRFVVLMDNAGAHKKKEVKDFIEAQEVQVLCNGPMTPHVQPIEYIFSMFKRELKRISDSGRDRLQLLIGVYKAFHKVGEMKTEIYNTFLHTFKFYKPILKYQDLSAGTNLQSSTNKVLKSYLELTEKKSSLMEVMPVDLT